MLFNSYIFLFAFLPLTFWVYFLLARRGHERAITWLVLASLFFYAWWNPRYLFLILLSMLVNFAFGRAIGDAAARGRRGVARALLVTGVTLNLVVLAYYKYAGFLVDNLNLFFDTGLDPSGIVLPLAISFFTFQQIAYLADAHAGVTREYRFLHYALFVTFFPQLIAGPIVHHREMLPQFASPEALRARASNLSVGLTIFFIGLFKKAVLADGIAAYSSPVFDSALNGAQPDLLLAWLGALGYSFQLYFDFSGYSDMAIGAARLFGIRLPLNFHSPYKATNIVEFWRRWHMTLSRFLRDYLYIPLGGNRKGRLRRHVNLMTTMLLGGLWHGAGWSFVIWGGLHGLYLIVHHAWRHLRDVRGRSSGVEPTRFAALGAWLLTFLAVVVGWVFFRAASLDAAVAMLRGMVGLNGIVLPNSLLAVLGDLGQWGRDLGIGTRFGGGTELVIAYAWVVALGALALLAPNTQELLAAHRPALRAYPVHEAARIEPLPTLAAHLRWAPGPRWALVTGVVAAMGILALSSVSEFLYFQF